jgi:hypothetical protein
MPLRAHSSVSDYEVPFILLSFLFVCVLATIVLIAVFKGKESQVVIYTPRLGSMGASYPTDPTETTDAIHIRIQFSPQRGIVKRFRAPSSLDLGPSAIATPEAKKDI